MYTWSELYDQAIEGGATKREAVEYADQYSDEHSCNFESYPTHWLG